MSVVEATTDVSPIEIECTLSASDSYIETLTIKQIEAQPWLTELVIKTQLLTAKNPEEKRVKARCCIERGRVIELKEAVERLLIETAAAEAAAKRHGAQAISQGQTQNVS
jgi:hypothetical protein